MNKDMQVHVYVHIYIYVCDIGACTHAYTNSCSYMPQGFFSFMFLSASSLSLSIRLFVFIHMHICIYIYVRIYISRYIHMLIPWFLMSSPT